eukprot:6473888-Amphidinium_carterae.2
MTRGMAQPCCFLSCIAAIASLLPGGHAISCNVGRQEKYFGRSCSERNIYNLASDVPCPSTSTECVTEAYTYDLRNGCTLQVVSGFCNDPQVDHCKAGEIAYDLLTTGLDYGCSHCEVEDFWRGGNNCNPKYYFPPIAGTLTLRAMGGIEMIQSTVEFDESAHH